LAASYVTGPVFSRVQRKALASGKEDPARVSERWGLTDQVRPEGPVVWFHAASVGETQSILWLVNKLLDNREDLNVLITSTSRTSAALLANQLPARATHQMAPYDTVNATRAFLDHWQPDLAIWVESEIWPRMLHEARARTIPCMLMSARISTRTAARWKKFAATAKSVLSSFETIHVQESATLSALSAVGVSGPSVVLTGSLKQDSPPLACDFEELSRLMNALNGKSVWCAASTHPGEDEIVLAAHKSIGGLLILVPRHAERATAIADLCAAHGLVAAQRSLGTPLDDTTDVYIADTMGELGLWYRMARASLICGSLTRVGGHNPYEAAQLGSVILHGPNVSNFLDIYQRLGAHNSALLVSDEHEIAKALNGLDDVTRDRMTAGAQAVLKAQQGATEPALAAILEKVPSPVG
jgi:3-deoxy-D-manno-octulosonic-acid transferase